MKFWFFRCKSCKQVFAVSKDFYSNAEGELVCPNAYCKTGIVEHEFIGTTPVGLAFLDKDKEQYTKGK
jgi:hypothetical protein